MIHPFFAESKSAIAFCLSTKDRTHLTKEMLPPFLAEGRYDLFWLDGSGTAEGRQLPFEVQKRFERLREIHTEVYGGPDVAIVRAFTRMIECGYEYCGLIENDVRLKTGWFANLMGLWEKGKMDGLNVGAVGSRTYRSRMLIPRGDFAVMFNLGAGMILLSRAAVKVVLNGFRTTNMYEIFAAALYGGGTSLKAKSGPLSCAALVNSVTTADWWFDSLLQLNGFCSLAPVPTMALNIDPEAQALMGDDYVHERSEISDVDEKSFQRLEERQASLASKALEDRVVPNSRIFLTNPELGGHIVLPHQGLALGGCRLAGEWKLKWSQTFGPFTFIAQNRASTLELQCFGDSCGVCMMCGPNCGAVEARAGDLVIAQIALYRDRSELVIIHLQLPHFDAWQIEIRPIAIEGADNRSLVQWGGLTYKDVQPWFSVNTGFEFSVLEKFL